MEGYQLCKLKASGELTQSINKGNVISHVECLAFIKKFETDKKDAQTEHEAEIVNLTQTHETQIIKLTQAHMTRI